jgi:hypothetical protein
VLSVCNLSALFSVVSVSRSAPVSISYLFVHHLNTLIFEMMSQVVGALLLVASMNSFASADGEKINAKLRKFLFLTTHSRITTLISFAVGKWMVTKQNNTCLIVQMDIEVNFTYTTNGKIKELRQISFP